MSNRLAFFKEFLSRLFSATSSIYGYGNDQMTNLLEGLHNIESDEELDLLDEIMGFDFEDCGNDLQRASLLLTGLGRWVANVQVQAHDDDLNRITAVKFQPKQL